jgi:methionyl-tRNA synthetase
MADPYYLTTAIHYPNGRPHIGHAYEAIAADVIARFKRATGHEVRFQTGTDEHGLKMVQKARELDCSPNQLAEEMSLVFRDLFDGLDVSYDVFIRTSEARHHRASQALWQALEKSGDLYLSRYEGWYSVRDEAYYDEKELDRQKDGSFLSPQGTPVEWTEEESWFFRLSSYQDRLLEILQRPGFVEPDSRRNEMLAFVAGGLNDLSVSRTSLDWGVKVPRHDDHVMYVWVDALTNYLTGLGYPDDTPEMRKFWPADLHLIGKDIVRFHSVYWIAFLLSAGVALPQKIFGHGFLLNRGQKESKSLGNVTDPAELTARFGSDALRYFLMSEVVFGQDGSYSAEALIGRVNAELVNGFGNLAQRVLSMVHKNCSGRFVTCVPMEGDAALLERVRHACAEELPMAFEQLAFSRGIEAWVKAVHLCNQYVDEQAPWVLRKTDARRMETVLMVLVQAVRELAIAIRPVVPRGADALLDQLGAGEGMRTYDVVGSTDWFDELVERGHAIPAPAPVWPRLVLEAQAA